MTCTKCKPSVVAPDEVILCNHHASAEALYEAANDLLEVCACPNGCAPNDMTCATNKMRAALTAYEGK